MTEYCTVIGTHSTVRGDKLFYGQIPDPFSRCGLGSDHARLRMCVREGLVTHVQILGLTSEFENNQWNRKMAFIRIMWWGKNLCTVWIKCFHENTAWYVLCAFRAFYNSWKSLYTHTVLVVIVRPWSHCRTFKHHLTAYRVQLCTLFQLEIPDGAANTFSQWHCPYRVTILW